MTKNPLQKQLENQRFIRAISYVLQSAGGIKKINTGELVHLNQILTDFVDDPWRFGEAKVVIPSGQTHHFNVITNPLNKARDILSAALQSAGNGNIKEGALYAYTELVLAHLFKDANRRTAVLATLWILESHGISVDAQELLQIPLGDLRQQKDLETFTQAFTNLTKGAPP